MSDEQIGATAVRRLSVFPEEAHVFCPMASSGVCFDRKGLYWISQWHSQQKKNREWFGVKRLGFRKAWALAVCVRRDAEKVEDEPIDYPHIPVGCFP